MSEFNYNILPLKASIDAYVKDGVPVGDFLRAVLSNNLREAFAQADMINIDLLYTYINYIYWECPGDCWGSLEAYYAWIEMKRQLRQQHLIKVIDPHVDLSPN